MNSILLVNADIDLLVTLSATLTKSGYCVIAKPDGASALSTLEQEPGIDLIISNYSLSDMNGLSLFGTLKASMRDTPPVILFSDRVDVMTYLTALRHGIFEFLFSPIDPRELLRIARVAIEQRQGRNSVTSGVLSDPDSRMFPHYPAVTCRPRQ